MVEATRPSPPASPESAPTKTMNPGGPKKHQRQLVRRMSSSMSGDLLGTLVSELTLSPSSTEEDRQERAQRSRFLVFVRILFKLLDTVPCSHSSCPPSLENYSSTNDAAAAPDPAPPPSLRTRAKRAVRECVSKNRRGVEGYSPLVDALVANLRELDGMERHWELAERYMRRYLAVRGEREREKKRAVASGAAASAASRSGSDGDGHGGGDENGVIHGEEPRENEEGGSCTRQETNACAFT